MPIDKNKFKDMAYWLKLKFNKIKYHNEVREHQTGFMKMCLS